MKCKDTRGQIVMPVFYGVDPSEVRKQKRKYEEAFLKHEAENKNKVESWRKALVDASNMSGWEPKNIANGHEAQGVKEIVDKISSRLLLVTASANEELVGIAARVQHLKSRLQIGTGGVRMIGIWGVGGGGKTTLASSVYDEVCRKFDSCCFMETIREESKRRGLEYLQGKILSKMKANNVGGGRCLISQRLRNRKVLIVLDDVDQLDQLKALAGSLDWFGEGSRIIITTRDEHILNAHKVVVYKISLLHTDEAIELFRKHAPPRGSLPMKDYEKLSEEVVTYAGGLPLALTVLGSSLCDKNIDQWKSALARLKNIPDDKILEKLKVSFDGLTEVQQELFLDIACFFRRNYKDDAMERLDASGLHPVIGVEELRQKALITISKIGMFDMHDLVQEMGHHIVRGKHPKNPEKHSRVWKDEDLLRISAMDATTELDSIQAIHVDGIGMPIFEEPPAPPIVANMRNLRYIQWRGDLFFNNFPPRELCCLRLFQSTQEQLGNGYKNLPNMKMMELSYLTNLITTPNFEGIPNLDRLKIWCCPALEEVHSSFGGLVSLVSLRIEQCKGIKKFPSITRLRKLETLSFRGSPGLFELSEIQQKMESLGDADIISPAVLELSKMSKIQHCLFRSDLTKLNLSECELGDEDMRSAVWELPNLQELNLSWNEFSQLNFILIRTPQLKLLQVNSCLRLLKLSDLPSSIAILEAEGCTSLETIGDVSNRKWLWKVKLQGSERIGPLDCDMLVDSMLKGNAIKDYNISITSLPHPPERIVDGLFMGKTYTMQLPHDWYNDSSGFCIHFVTCIRRPHISIVMKQEGGDEDSRFDLHQESDEAPEESEEAPEESDEASEESDEALEESNEASVVQYNKPSTYVGYVSFNSLRDTTCVISTCTVISICLHQSRFSPKYDTDQDRIGVTLVPRKSKDDLTQTTEVTTDRSEFWDDDRDDNYIHTFTIEHDSKCSIKILWRPNY